MATIYGPVTGHATLHDTAGNDTIIAAGGNNTIIDLGGNDTISGGSLGGNVILAGTSGDGVSRSVSVHLNGIGNTIIGGDANFTITSWAGGLVTDLGNGNNTIDVLGARDTLTVGLGFNTITVGTAGQVVSDSTILVVGMPSPTDDAPHGGDNITIYGRDNTVINQSYNGSAMAAPVDIPTTLIGGSGDGTFELTGGGTVRTDGTGNTIAVADGSWNIVAGSGQDTLYINDGIGTPTTTATVRLNGLGNVVSAFADTVTVLGGTGDARVTLGAAPSGTNTDVVNLGGMGNSITAESGSGRIDAGGSGATILLSDANFELFVHGTADFIGLGDQSKGLIDDNASGLGIDITGHVNETIDNFGFNRGDVVTIDLAAGGFPQPFATAAQVLTAVTSTAAGAVLSFDGGQDKILFAGVSASQLSTHNFAV